MLVIKAGSTSQSVLIPKGQIKSWSGPYDLVGQRVLASPSYQTLTQHSTDNAAYQSGYYRELGNYFRVDIPNSWLAPGSRQLALWLCLTSAHSVTSGVLYEIEIGETDNVQGVAAVAETVVTRNGSTSFDVYVAPVVSKGNEVIERADIPEGDVEVVVNYLDSAQNQQSQRQPMDRNSNGTDTLGIGAYGTTVTVNPNNPFQLQIIMKLPGCDPIITNVPIV